MQKKIEIDDTFAEEFESKIFVSLKEYAIAYLEMASEKDLEYIIKNHTKEELCEIVKI